jgi:hexosaminidase
MFRPLFIFKILIFSLVINIVLVLYLLLPNTHRSFLINKNNIQYEVNDYLPLFGNDYISTNIKIIPAPMFVNFESSALLLSNGFSILSNQKPTKDLHLAMIRYAKYISLLTDFSINIDQNSSPSHNALNIDCSSIHLNKNKYPKLGEDESYTLNISRTGIYLHGLTLTGIIRGLSTFVQLIEQNKSAEKIFVPFVRIVDRPRFPWRGLLLDVCRHWMPVSVIERTLNAMELSKLNVLHLHLSDDQGFRVESLQHPLLHDRKNFFTQKDIQYLIEYARQRRIRIVPEFDIPGHTTR